MADFVSPSELLEALKTAISGRKSGAFFITSADQHSAIITVRSGQITGVKYRNSRGYEAASQIAAMDQLRFSTSADLTELPGQPELDTNRVLETLDAGAEGGADVPSEEPTSDSGTATMPGEIVVDSNRLDALRERYIGAIGPIGGAVFDEERDDVGTAVHSQEGFAALIERLVAQIDDEGEASRFRADAQRQLDEAVAEGPVTTKGGTSGLE